MEMIADRTSSGRNHRVSHLFSEEYKYDGAYPLAPTVVLTRYNSDKLEWKELNPDETTYSPYVDPECMNWFQVIGLSDSKLVSRFLSDFGFHAIDSKAILTPSHAAKIDLFNKSLIIVIRPCYYEHKHQITSEHVCILAKDNVVITFKERGKLSLDNVRLALRVNMMNIRAGNRGILIAFILNAILSSMIDTAINIEEALENIDNTLLNAEHGNTNLGKKIQHCQHANLIIQRNTIPLRHEFNKLLNSDLVIRDADLLPVYRELYNQLDFILLTSESSKEILSSLRDLYVSNNDLKTNTVMKRLTVVSTLFIPVTFWAAIWGMNFQSMPELEWQYGYLLAWTVLSLTVFLTWRFMKKHKWF